MTKNALTDIIAAWQQLLAGADANQDDLPALEDVRGQLAGGARGGAGRPRAKAGPHDGGPPGRSRPPGRAQQGLRSRGTLPLGGPASLREEQLEARGVRDEAAQAAEAQAPARLQDGGMPPGTHHHR